MVTISAIRFSHNVKEAPLEGFCAFQAALICADLVHQYTGLIGKRARFPNFASPGGPRSSGGCCGQCSIVSFIWGKGVYVLRYFSKTEDRIPGGVKRKRSHVSI
jgi:hypothetical protein